MLYIKVPSQEYYNEKTETFGTVKEQTLQLEHSLVSISKWESVWCKPFLTSNDKTPEESLDYVRCMTLTQNVDPNVYYNILPDTLNTISKYIESPMSATTFYEDNKKSSKEQITSELIYYWMIASNIPFECQKWHLNRLLTLIRVCSIKNTPNKKMTRQEIFNRNRALNAERRAKAGSKG